MKKRIMILLMMSAFLVFSAGNAMTLLMADIAYDYTDNGGGNYAFDFTVRNNSYEPSMSDLFGIEFDADVITNYSNITWNNDQGWGHTEAKDFGKTRYEGVQPVPKPANMILLGTGLLGLFGFQRKVIKK
jgi:hypothetical protein